MNSHVTVVEFVLMGIGIFFLGLSFYLQGRVERLRDENRSLKDVNRILRSQVEHLNRLTTKYAFTLRELAGKRHNYTQVDPGSRNDEGPVARYSCPACDKVWVLRSFRYCPECGKALDWSKVEEEKRKGSFLETFRVDAETGDAYFKGDIIGIAL